MGDTRDCKNETIMEFRGTIQWDLLYNMDVMYLDENMLLYIFNLLGDDSA